jgi:membrane protein
MDNGHGGKTRVTRQDRPRARGRAVRVATAATARGTAAAERGKNWVEAQDPASSRGVAIGWYRRFRESDGGLFTVLLSAYFFVTAIPATVVMVDYVFNDASKAAARLTGRLGLTGETKTLVYSVLTGAAGHQLGATLIAVGDVLIFGMGFGRVLQVAHARSWRIDLGKPQIADQLRYVLTLLVPLGFVLVFVLQARALHGQPSWIGWLFLPLWLVALLWYFVWVPRMLLHGRVSRRDVMPGAMFTILGLVALRLISAVLFKHWLVWYGKYYGSIGIVMALFFWIMLPAGALILAAAFSPALAHRRELRQARAAAGVAAATGS